MTHENFPPVLKRLGLDRDSWCELVSDFGKLFCTVAGRAEQVDLLRSHDTHRRYHLRRRARELFADLTQRVRMLSNSLLSIQSLLTDEFLLSENRSHSISFDSFKSCRSVHVEKLANRCSVRCPVLMSHRIAALRPVSKRAGGDVTPYQIRSPSNQHRLIAPHLASKEL